MLDTMTKLRRVRLTGEPQEGQVHIILDLNKDDVLTLGVNNGSIAMPL